MEQEVDLAAHVHVLRDVAVDQLEARVPREVGDVAGGAGEEVVQAHDVPPRGEQRLTQVAAEEARTPRDDRPAGPTPLCWPHRPSLVVGAVPQHGGGHGDVHSERARTGQRAGVARRRSASGRVSSEAAPPTSTAVLKDVPAATAPMTTAPIPVPASKPTFHTALADP